MRAADTSVAAARAQIELFRQAGVARRVSLARSLSRTVFGLSWQAVSDRHPDATIDEVRVAFAEVCFGADLARKLERYLESRRGPA